MASLTSNHKNYKLWQSLSSMDLIQAGAWGHLWRKEVPLEEKYDWMTEEVKELFG